MLTSLSKLDILDGHIYWNQYVGVGDVPMVNDPLHSTVVQLSRTAFAGKPFTVSETNHPFPERVRERRNSDPRRLRRFPGLGHDHHVHFRAQEGSCTGSPMSATRSTFRSTPSA